MRKYLILLVLFFSVPAFAQINVQTISASGTVSLQTKNNLSTLFNITLTGNVTAASIDSGFKGQQANFNICQNSVGGFVWAWPATFQGTSTTIVATGALLCTQAQFVNVDGTTWQNIGGGGSSVTTTASIPGEPGVTGVPVTSGLMAEYRMLPTETAAGLLDYSGNTRNATGTVGTAPTIIPVTGGLSCVAGGVQLPAALNSALTIQLLVSYQWANATNANTTNIFVGGNGANSVQLGVSSLTDSFGFSPTIAGGQRLRSLAPTPATTKGASRDVFQGVHVLTLLMDSTGDRFFIDSQEVTYYASGLLSAGLQTNGNHQLCGVTPNYAVASIYYAAFYGRVLTNAEVAANTQFITRAMAARGVNLLNGATDAQSQLICDGDSLTAAGTTYCTAFSIPAPTSAVLQYSNPIQFNTADQGLNGAGSLAMTTNIPTDTLSLIRPLAASNITTQWVGTNDGNAALSYPNIRGYCTAVRAAGSKCLPFTMISRGSLDVGVKNPLNDYLRVHWPEFADGLVDLAANPNLGADGASANATYFTDGIHLTATGNALVTGIAQQAILRAAGNANPITVPPQFQAVQSASTFCSTSVSTCAVVMPNATTVGNLVFVLVHGVSGQAINTPTDTRASTWTSVSAAVSSSGKPTQAFFAANVTAGAETITVTFGASGTNTTISAVEYSGAATVTPLDAAPAIVASLTSTGAVSNSVTTTGAGELLITYGTAFAGSALPAPRLSTTVTSTAVGSIIRSVASNSANSQWDVNIIADNLSGVTGAYTSSYTTSGILAVNAIGIAAFKTGTRALTYQMTGADITINCLPTAGNSTVNLPDAIGFTGQTFTVKNTQTAGANTCTVAAINSETIDGAASVTVANKATLIVKSVLVSPAAGGANWVQVQNN